MSVRALALAAALIACAARANAKLLIYEPLDYEPGTLAGRSPTGTNLTGHYDGAVQTPGAELQVVSPGLDYGKLTGAPKPKGNRLTQNRGPIYAVAKVPVDNDVIIAPGSEIYFSALFRLDDSANGKDLASIRLEDDTNADEVSFGEPMIGARTIRVSATTQGTGGLVKAAGADHAFDDGETLLLVGRYQNSAAAHGDVIELIGYDTAVANKLPEAFDPKDPHARFAYRLDGVDIDLGRVTSIRFQIHGQTNNFLDELRVGTTYADVVPEPGTAGLLGAGLAGLALRARRRAPR